MDYLYIRVWGYRLRSSIDYIDRQVEQAKKESAPEKAVFKYDDGTWCTIDECCNETKELVERDVKYIRLKAKGGTL